MTAIKLRPYQIEGVEFAHKHKRVFIGHPMRLGKTAIAINAFKLSELFEPKILVIVPKAALHVWQNEFALWGLDVPDIIHGNLHLRTDLWTALPWVITTYGTMIKDVEAGRVPQYWDYIICDEAKRVRNRKSKAFKCLKQLKCEYAFWLDGKPYGKGPQDVWTAFNYFNPKRYSSYWKFINTFCIIAQTHFGNEIVGSRNKGAFNRIRDHYFIRRTRAEVLPDLPEKPQRQIIPLDLGRPQRTLHDGVIKDMLAFDDQTDAMIWAQNKMTAILRARQILVCPKILDANLPDGTAIDFIVEHLKESDDQHVVIFTPFTSVFPFLEEALLKGGLGPLIKFSGKLSAKQLRESLDRFKESKGQAVCSIKFAQAFDLSSASIGYMLGYEWDPDDNEQAEARLEKADEHWPVHIYYIKHIDTEDEHVLEQLNEKHIRVSPMYMTKAELKEVYHGH